MGALVLILLRGTVPARDWYKTTDHAGGNHPIDVKSREPPDYFGPAFGGRDGQTTLSDQMRLFGA